MATGYRNPNASDFLEEWKARREKLRSRIPGAPPAPSPAGGLSSSSSSTTATATTAFGGGGGGGGGGGLRNGAPGDATSQAGGGLAPSVSGLAGAFNSLAVAPAATARVTGPGATAGRRLAEPPAADRKAAAVVQERTGGGGGGADAAGAVASIGTTTTGTTTSSTTGTTTGTTTTGTTASSITASSITVSSSLAVKEKKAAAAAAAAGPSARKSKGQIEKRKLREKRRSTGVVNLTAESPEEDEEEVRQKHRPDEEEATQHNTLINETSPRPSPMGRWKGAGGAVDEAAVVVTAAGQTRAGPDCLARAPRREGPAGGALERRVDELEKELARERYEKQQLGQRLEDNEDVVRKLHAEIDLLNRDLDDLEDENEQLKEENKTLLRVVGQLTK